MAEYQRVERKTPGLLSINFMVVLAEFEFVFLGEYDISHLEVNIRHLGNLVGLKVEPT